MFAFYGHKFLCRRRPNNSAIKAAAVWKRLADYDRNLGRSSTPLSDIAASDAEDSRNPFGVDM